MITFFVKGFPIPQGSLRKGNGDGLRYSNEFELKQWRDRVRDGATAAMVADGRAMFTSKVYLGLDFYFGPATPIFGQRKFDLDKLVRAVCDALTDAQAYGDDSQVTKLIASKRIMPPDGHAGVAICLDLDGGSP